jgi:putative glutamine amidotransferase
LITHPTLAGNEEETQPLYGSGVRKPRIGITSTPSDVDGPQETVNRPYVNAVVAAGGLPVIMPVLEPADAEAMLAGLDGLLLTGGPDLNPALYGEEPVDGVYGVNDQRDSWEMALVGQSRIPMLGICRGMQMLNVAAGGSLVLHLPTITDLNHTDREHRHEMVHGVHTAPGSQVWSVIGEEALGVNTLHHQAVRDLGDGLIATAWGTDGTIEALESSAGRPVLAVQWHPELLADSACKRLFTWLVDQSAAVPIALAAVSMDDRQSAEDSAVA